jgi:hypothetical protein
MEGLPLMRISLGRRVRDLRILAVSDGEQSVLDEGDNRIRGHGYR